MLKLYYHPISTNTRRVWVTLLEKQLAFELEEVDLGGEQFSEHFTAINALQRIPVLIDQDLQVIESLAIMDYLEAKYPTPSLLPREADALAKVRMVEMTAVNELQPNMMPFMRQLVGLEVDLSKVDAAHQRLTTVLQVYDQLLGDQAYIGGETVSLADIVAGTLVPVLPRLGIALDSHPAVAAWVQRLEQRDSWQQTAIQPEMIEAAIPKIRAILERRS